MHACLGDGLDTTLEDRLHEVDAAAWGLRLEACDAVRRAGLEAHPAVDALLQAVLHREGLREDLHQNAKRPGESTPFGSKRAFSERPIASGVRGVPQVPTARRSPVGARSTKIGRASCRERG